MLSFLTNDELRNSIETSKNFAKVTEDLLSERSRDGTYKVDVCGDNGITSTKSQRKRDTSRTSAAVKSKAPVQSSRRNRPTKSKPEKSEPVARKRKPSEPETLSDWILHPSGDWSYNPKGQ